MGLQREGELTDHNGPHLNKHKQSKIRKLLQRKNKREHVVRHALQESIQRMESVARIWCRHDPLVVWLMERPIYHGVVEPTVNQINPEIGPHEEQRKLQPHIRLSVITNILVQQRVPADLCHEEGHGKDGHDWDRSHCLRYFLPYLVLEKFRMLECVFVEDEHIGQRCEGEVYNEAENPALEFG